MDDAATAELSARASLAAGRDARRAPAVQYVSRWTHDLDVPGVRCGGVRAGATCGLSCPRRAARDAQTLLPRSSVRSYVSLFACSCELIALVCELHPGGKHPFFGIVVVLDVDVGNPLHRMIE
jgi:hypothetical protein